MLYAPHELSTRTGCRIRRILIVGVGQSVEDAGILLSVVEFYGDSPGANVGHAAFEQHSLAQVGFFVRRIGIEEHHITLPEVGQEILALIGNRQGDEVETVISVGLVTLLHINNGESGVDISRFALLRQGHVPQVGHAVAGAFDHSHLRHEVFPDGKLHHPAEVSALQRLQVLQWPDTAFELWSQVGVIEVVIPFLPVQFAGVEFLEHVLHSVTRDVIFQCHRLVAEPYGLIEQFHEVCHAHQSVGEGIFRVEQSDVGVRDVKVVIQNTIVEQQLHIVFLHHFGPMSVGDVAFEKDVSARLLLHQQPEVGGHEVHASLKSQFLAYERRLEYRA